MKKFFTLLLLVTFTMAHLQAQFTSNNLVALRVTPNPSAFAQSGPVSLIEYSKTGTATGYSVDIPSTDPGARLQIGGTNSYDGQLNLSGDAEYLCFAGYDVSNNTNTATQYAATKVIAKVAKNGTVDLSTQIPNSIFTATGVRGVTTQNGSGFWVSSGSGTIGTHYVASGATNSTTQIGAARYQSLAIANNILFGANSGIGYFPSPPTSSATATSTGTFNASALNNTQFVFLDMDPARNYVGQAANPISTPYDVLYIADAAGSNGTTGLGISKYYSNFSGSAWILAGVYDVAGGTALIALTGNVVGGAPVLYAVKGNVANNEIIAITDNAGRDMPMSAGTTTVTTLATAGTNKFFRGIAFTPGTSTIPVELASFKGSLIKGKAALRWITASEVNVKAFIVEKSSNAKDFISIGTVAAKNTNAKTTYDFDDNKLNEDLNYYRLKMMDNDGTFKYSNVVAIKSDSKSAKGFGIFPNPATNQITVNHTAAAEGALIKIVSVTGSVVAQHAVAKETTQTMIDASQLPTGHYFINYLSKGISSTTSFIK